MPQLNHQELILSSMPPPLNSSLRPNRPTTSTILPPSSLCFANHRSTSFSTTPEEVTERNEQEQAENINNIRRVLSNFGIGIARIEATVGPTVTLYEIVPAEGVRINRIRSLEDDIALSLSALGIRIIAPMPGKGTIGIEVPNKKPRIVSIRSILASRKYQESTAELPMAMGSHYIKRCLYRRPHQDAPPPRGRQYRHG